MKVNEINKAWYHGVLDLKTASIICKPHRSGNYLVWKPATQLKNDAFVITAKENDSTLAHYVIEMKYPFHNACDSIEDKLASVLRFYCYNVLDGSESFTTLKEHIPRSIQPAENQLNIVADTNYWCNSDGVCVSKHNINYISNRISFYSSFKCVSEEMTSFNERSDDVIAPELIFSKPPSCLLNQRSVTSPIFKFENVLGAPSSFLSGSDLSLPSVKSSTSSRDESEDDVITHPASCSHASRPRADGFYISSDAVDAQLGTMPKSYSTQDLSYSKTTSSLSRNRKRDSQKSSFSQTFLRTFKRGSDSKSNIGEEQNSLELSDSYDSIFDSSDKPNQSYYKSFEDLTFDEPKTNQHSLLALKTDKCTRVTSSYAGGVWKEIGCRGGIVQVSGSDVSLHVSAATIVPPETCELCSGIRKKSNARERNLSLSNPRERRFSIGQSIQRRKVSRSASSLRDVGAMIKDFDCPTFSDSAFDGRLVVGLEDPPDCMMLSNNTENIQKSPFSRTLAQCYVIAGPTVQVDLPDKRVLDGGAVLQIRTNLILKENIEHNPGDISMKGFGKLRFTCLQSHSLYGPYKELSNVYHYGNSLQVTLDTSHIISKSTGVTCCHVYVVPVAKHAKEHFSSAPVWDGVARKTYNVGVYGPKHTYERSTCCVSLSSSGFSPPILRIQHDKLTQLTLRLWDSFLLTVHNVQGYHMSVTTEKSSSIQLKHEENGWKFTDDELRAESRINRVFILQHASTSHGKAKIFKNQSGERRFVVELTGIKDRQKHRFKCRASPLKVIEYPRALSPILTRRLNQSAESSFAAIMDAGDYAYQWLIAQQEDKLYMKATTEYPQQDRRLFSVRLGYTVKSSNNRKRNVAQWPHLLDIQHGEYIPILSQNTLWSRCLVSKKEWWIGYSKHRVGLIRTNCIRIFDFKDFSNWNKVQVVASKLIEAVIDPVAHLKCDLPSVRIKLNRKVRFWPQIAIVLRFGEAFASNSIDKELNEIFREKKIYFYITKYFEYCTTSPRRRSFHREVIRALLYTEQYELAVELVTDFCILSVSIEFATRWKELAQMLIGKMSHEDEERFTKSSTHVEIAEMQETWKPAYNFLIHWRKRFDTNHEGALLGLHQVVDCLSDSRSKTWQYVTQCVILARTIETLCKYDTRL